MDLPPFCQGGGVGIGYGRGGVDGLVVIGCG